MNSTIIDTGDLILHKPSKEKWLVALVEDKKLYWCGYPFGGYANLDDCTLLGKATEEEKMELLEALAIQKGNERPIVFAKEYLSKLKEINNG